jgi:hypothetical protein
MTLNSLHDIKEAIADLDQIEATGEHDPKYIAFMRKTYKEIGLKAGRPKIGGLSISGVAPGSEGAILRGSQNI